jgi:hypothetical protein
VFREPSPHLLCQREGEKAKAIFTMNVNDLLAAAGGLDEDGTVRLPQVLWKLLGDAPKALVFSSDRSTVIGEVRLAPSGAGVYHVQGEGYVLLSPQELEDLPSCVTGGGLSDR